MSPRSIPTFVLAVSSTFACPVAAQGRQDTATLLNNQSNTTTRPAYDRFGQVLVRHRKDHTFAWGNSGVGTDNFLHGLIVGSQDVDATTADVFDLTGFAGQSTAAQPDLQSGFQRGPFPHPLGQPTVAAATPAAVPVATLVAAAPRATPTAVATATAPGAPTSCPGTLSLPDGSKVQALNGVANPPAMSWAREVPYAPIVGTRRAVWPELGELEWYVHADGTQTTTLTTGAGRGGRGREAVTIVAHPGPAGLVPESFVIQDGEAVRETGGPAPGGTPPRWVR